MLTRFQNIIAEVPRKSVRFCLRQQAQEYLLFSSVFNWKKKGGWGLRQTILIHIMGLEGKLWESSMCQMHRRGTKRNHSLILLNSSFNVFVIFIFICILWACLHYMQFWGCYWCYKCAWDKEMGSLGVLAWKSFR